jgi:hypothetical protein
MAMLGPMARLVSSSSLVWTVLSEIQSGTSFFSTCRFAFSPKVMLTYKLPVVSNKITCHLSETKRNSVLYQRLKNRATNTVIAR